MKPKAKKFRIRRGSALGPGGGDDGVKSGEPTPRPPRPPSPRGSGLDQRRVPDALGPDERSTISPREEIEQIKAEGLTGRQLRIARREAQKLGMNASSDLDAVRLLRRAGHDPFKRSDMLELVVSGTDGDLQSNLPAAIRNAPPPSKDVITPDLRARDVQQIQLDLARRRRKRLGLLIVRLAFFVFFPTILAGYYYYNIASPMFATKSEFVIQKAESSSPGALGGLFDGTGLAANQDSVIVQGYLNSREAMVRLDRDHGFKSHFTQPGIDSIQRLEPGSSLEAAYRVYQKRVKIGYDPTEGVIKMEVVAATPEASGRFSQALISYAEEQVDLLTQRVRGDHMTGARDSFEETEEKMFAAQRRVLELQEERGVLSADLEITSRMQQISAFEIELRNRRLELAELKDNPRPNRTKVDIAEKSIARLENLVVELRAEMTEGTNSTASLAKISGELVIAQADLQTRQLMLSQSLQQLETARVEANRQVRYLSVGVRPVPPDEATYPRSFENTLLAFLIFGGLYLMASLTTSILREQVTA